MTQKQLKYLVRKYYRKQRKFACYLNRMGLKAIVNTRKEWYQFFRNGEQISESELPY